MKTTTVKSIGASRLCTLVPSIVLVTATSIMLNGCSLNKLTASSKDNSDLAVNVNSTKKANVDKTITLAQVTKDVSYLASDELKGRGNYSNDIRKAADYIAKRFNQVGLSSVTGIKNFKQTYTIQKVTPQTLTVQLNGKIISQEDLSIVTTQNHLNWQNIGTNEPLSTPPVNIVFIGENDDLRQSLSHLNHQGGEHLVLLHPTHKNTFTRYQGYFARGITKLMSSDTPTKDNKKTVNDGGSIVIALTAITKVEEFSVTSTSTVTSTALSNVVGVLPGKSKAHEIVLYSAHYDHLGVVPNIEGKASQPHHIYNGADDDASGVSAIINLAHHFSQVGNNERTLMFAAFSAEEIGGFGSRYFAKQIDANAITAMINIEMIGKPAVFGEGSVWMTGMERSNLGEQLNEALAPKKLTIYADPYPNQNLFYRSDNATLARLGVPAHSFSSTQLDKDQHYHQVSDDINSLHLPSLLKVVKTLAIATTPLVEGTVTPNRIDTNKVNRHGFIY